MGAGAVWRVCLLYPRTIFKKLHSPVLFLLGGPSDIAYANGSDDFRRIEKLPAFMANMDVGHGGTYGRPHGGEFGKVAVTWFDWQLKGDQEAAKMFTGRALRAFQVVQLESREEEYSLTDDAKSPARLLEACPLRTRQAPSPCQ